MPTVDLTFEPRGILVAEVFPRSPASEAGLLAKDRILAVDDQPVAFGENFIRHIHGHLGKPVALTIERGTETKTLIVTPEIPIEGGGDKPKPSIGIQLDRADGLVFDLRGKMSPVFPSPYEQIAEATGMIIETMKKLSPTSKSGISVQHMGGPVMMMRVYYLLFESPEGWRLVLWFSVVINVNLAIMNMLPIPPLDGSHITLALIEMIRGRAPGARTQKMVEYVQIAGTFLVIGFMLFVTAFDVQDVFGGKKPTLRFPPRTPATQAPG